MIAGHHDLASAQGMAPSRERAKPFELAGNLSPGTDSIPVGSIFFPSSGKG
jgi:hypothetical protein